MRLQRYFLAGLAALLPLVVTLWVLAWVYRQALWLFGGLLGLLGVAPPPWLSPLVPLLGLAVAALFVVLFGMLASHWLGRRAVEAVERLFVRVPLVGEIYRATKQVAGGLFGRSELQFSRPALIEYPRKGIYALCFVVQPVGRRLPPLSEGHAVVVVPTSPVPASGFVLVVPEEELVPLAMGVDDALRFVVSVGFLLPEETAADLAGGRL